MYKHTFLLILSTLLLASSLGARTPEGPTTKPLPPDSLAAVYDLNQVVVTGTRHPRPLRTSPVLTQVVGQEQLRRGDWGEVTQVLENQLPGIEFSHGAYGSKDRKSTRLNSSHVRISYAVFCLKKKIESVT